MIMHCRTPFSTSSSLAASFLQHFHEDHQWTSVVAIFEAISTHFKSIHENARLGGSGPDWTSQPPQEHSTPFASYFWSLELVHGSVAVGRSEPLKVVTLNINEVAKKGIWSKSPHSHEGSENVGLAAIIKCRTGSVTLGPDLVQAKWLHCSYRPLL